MRGPTRLGMITYGAAAGTIDLGDEPPLVIGRKDDKGKTPGSARRELALAGRNRPHRRHLDRPHGRRPDGGPEQPQPVRFAARRCSRAWPPIPPTSSSARKATASGPSSRKYRAARSCRSSTVTRQGERDFIKLRPFAKINATLTVKDDALAAEVPAYDPMRIFADTVRARTAGRWPAAPPPPPADQLYGANVDGEVSVKVSAFPIDEPDLEPTADVPDRAGRTDRARRRPPAAARRQRRRAPLAYADAGRRRCQQRRGRSRRSACASCPENVSNIAKSDAADGSGDGVEDDVFPVAAARQPRHACSRDNGVADADADEIVKALSQLSTSTSPCRPEGPRRLRHLRRAGGSGQA